MLTREEIQALYDQGPDGVLEAITALQDAVGLLTLRVKQLEDRLGKDSHNSSKPPSSDGYNKPNPQSQRGKSGRRTGGHYSHDNKDISMLKAIEFVLPQNNANIVIKSTSGRRLL